MDFGLEKWEIETLFLETIKKGRKRFPAGGRLEHQQAEHIAVAVSEVVSENNKRILKALDSAGIKLRLD